MRLFQNSGLYPSYLARVNQLAAEASSFEARRRAFLDDRFGALHFLKPVLDGASEAFFTNGDDEILQRRWAREQGIAGKPTLEAILLAQIEHHRTEVFYNMDPVRYPGAFVRKLPGTVRQTLCWRAAPSRNADLAAYGAVLGNFPSILESWRSKGCRAELFFPAHDPVMDEYGHGDRPIDVLFVGGYSRHHSARAKTLEQVASLAGSRRIVYCLDASRLTKLAESVVGAWLPLQKHRRPDAIANIAKPPVFGRQLYELIGSSKIVLNGAIDLAGTDRGNMRCFEAMGCGALLVSDAGGYPDGMQPGGTIETYDSPEQATEIISNCLQHWPEVAEIARRGRRRVSQAYSKASQWKHFADLVARI
ncbi:glycosyltransferase family 1 protein [Bradyrhizobium sp. AUGA SZCCT0240]|uniref:glycosyltransferase family protein n=1 Tax=Bradyrhizobium sp. AUGA SZCCT0240 TaxID=2807669 RepID=UPI001BA989DF|nr:glycosyltransferase [Bradyrhizobium sp. AUGA SZCCT0240]MBR1257967.1 glycosyltransferase family 1 protein [Bradyrhizobium sp. AUGA SZCCT0240]